MKLVNGRIVEHLTYRQTLEQYGFKEKTTSFCIGWIFGDRERIHHEVRDNGYHCPSLNCGTPCLDAINERGLAPIKEALVKLKLNKSVEE